jgi:predicted regulator of Ras-like GTPase activity (Roadblock/LC7/MglB family)
MAEQTGHALLTLQNSLRPLLEADGILGGVLCTEDGLPLASALTPGLDEESLAAAGARVGQLSRHQLGDENLEAGVLDASRLRLVVRPVSLGYLVLAADPSAPIGPAVELAKQLAAAIEQTAAEAAVSDALRP